MQHHGFFSRLAAFRFFAAAVMVALVAAMLASQPLPAHADASTGTGGLFVPTVSRLWDSSNGTGGAPSVPLTRLTWYQVQVDGVGSIPASGVSAVVVSLVVMNPTQTGNIRADKGGVGSPNTSVTYANYSPGTGMTNTAVLPVGSNGKIQVQVTGATDLRIDTQGYYTAGATAAGGYVPVTATQLASTLDGSGGFPKATVANGSTVSLAVGGVSPIPSNASSVVLSVAESSSAAVDGWLIAYPGGTTRPGSALHWPSGKNYEFTTTVKLPSSGQVSVTIGGGGPVNLQVAVQGYFTQESGSNQAGSFTPGAARVYDSRVSGGQITAGETRQIQVTGVNGIPAAGSGITAVALNLAVIAPAGSQGHIQAYADDQNQGPAAQQFYASTTTSGFVVVPLGADGGIDLQTSTAGPIDVVVDVEGWYSGVGAPTISCPAPYANGSWTQAVPQSDFDCTVTAPQASYSAAQLVTTLDGDDYDALGLSASGATTDTITIPAGGGTHTLSASTTAIDGGSFTTTTYTFGVGNWAAATFDPSPTSGSVSSLTPELDVQPENDVYSADVEKQFVISTDPDGVSNPIAVSALTNGTYVVPSGLLSQNTTYYWTATITGTSGGSTTPTSVTTPVFSFTTVSSALASGLADPSTLTYNYVTGQSLDDVIWSAVKTYGASQVVANLNAVATSANSGADVSFPTLEGQDPASVATTLQSEASDVQSGALQSREAPIATPDNGTSNWSAHVGTSQQSGAPYNSKRRAWKSNLVIYGKKCGVASILVGCDVVDAWHVSVIVDGYLNDNRVQTNANHVTQTDPILKGTKLSMILYRNRYQNGDEETWNLPSGEDKFTYETDSSFKNSSLEFWQELLPQNGSLGSDGSSTSSHSGVADCGTSWCTWPKQ